MSSPAAIRQRPCHRPKADGAVRWGQGTRPVAIDPDRRVPSQRYPRQSAAPHPRAPARSPCLRPLARRGDPSPIAPKRRGVRARSAACRAKRPPPAPPGRHATAPRLPDCRVSPPPDQGPSLQRLPSPRDAWRSPDTGPIQAFGVLPSHATAHARLAIPSPLARSVEIWSYQNIFKLQNLTSTYLFGEQAQHICLDRCRSP